MNVYHYKASEYSPENITIRDIDNAGSSIEIDYYAEAKEVRYRVFDKWHIETTAYYLQMDNPIPAILAFSEQDGVQYNDILNNLNELRSTWTYDISRCGHEWYDYVGIIHKYKYCKHCNLKDYGI